MGFDAAHTINALSKLALRLMRNANKKEASQQMDMYFSAKRQTLAQFMEVYDQQRLHEIHGGSTIIFDAMAHQSPQDRYDIVRFLIAQGAELTGTNGESETLFHVCFRAFNAQLEAQYAALPEVFKHIFTCGERGNIQQLRDKKEVQAALAKFFAGED